MKRSSILLVVREMKIKTTIGCLLFPIRLAEMKSGKKSSSGKERWEMTAPIAAERLYAACSPLERESPFIKRLPCTMSCLA